MTDDSLAAETAGGPQQFAAAVPVLRPLLPSAEQVLPYLHRIDARRQYTNWGPLVSELEARLASHFGLPDHGVVTASSGTAALVGAVLATAGRATAQRPLALIPAYTFVATAIAAEQCGYQPYLLDVEATSWMLEPHRIQAHPMLERAGVVIPVGVYGRPVAGDAWSRFRRTTGVPVVIDAAAGFESVSRERAAFVSDIPMVLSLHATKSFAVGEGGCVLTQDEHIAKQVTEALNFGFYASRESRVASSNGKMSEYHAAVGLAELDGWERKGARWTAVGERYHVAAMRHGLTQYLVHAPAIAGCYVLFHARDVRHAARALAALESAGVEYRFWYGAGILAQPHYHQLGHDVLEVSDTLGRLVIGLPAAVDIPDQAIERVIDALARA